jgi:hypothetical protein
MIGLEHEPPRWEVGDYQLEPWRGRFAALIILNRNRFLEL